MTTFQKFLNVVLVLVIVLVGAKVFFPKQLVSLGGQVQNDLFYFTGGISIDTAGTGSTLNNVIVGSCNMIATYTTAATSTGQYSCAAPGVLSTDMVYSDPGTPQIVGGGGWVITATDASSSNGFIVFSLLNLTGAAATPTSTVASSTEFIDIR